MKYQIIVGINPAIRESARRLSAACEGDPLLVTAAALALLEDALEPEAIEQIAGIMKTVINRETQR